MDISTDLDLNYSLPKITELTKIDASYTINDKVEESVKD